MAPKLVQVLAAKDLAPKDDSGKSDPFVEVGYADDITGEFLPDPQTIRSEVVFKTVNPVWKRASLQITDPPKSHKIRVEVWDKDEGTKKDFEGFALIDLAEGDYWVQLHARKSERVEVSGAVHIVIS